MSEASLPQCLKCMSVSYDCECEEPEWAPSLVSQIMSGEFVDMEAILVAVPNAEVGYRARSTCIFKSDHAVAGTSTRNSRGQLTN
jgi:hypothetical protein